MATASHAAGLELRQTVWAMQALALGTGLEGSERYGLVSTVTAQIRMQLGIMRGAAMNVGAILAGDFVTAVGWRACSSPTTTSEFVAIQSPDCVSNRDGP